MNFGEKAVYEHFIGLYEKVQRDSGAKKVRVNIRGGWLVDEPQTYNYRIC